MEDALRWLDGRLHPLSGETVSLPHLAGRVLAEDMVSPIDVPAFDRAMMDGFALRSEDTAGATPYNPRELAVVGAALPGQPFDGEVTSGKAVRIMTGAPCPRGADAVLPVELTESDEAKLSAHGEVAPGKHIGTRGEDVRQGAVLLQKGRRLRPQDVGALASVGLAAAPVVRAPKVRVVVTGDELLAPGEAHRPFRIFDSNGPMLSALIARDGGRLLSAEVVPDQPDSILKAMRDPDADLVLVSGGSSVGEEDHAPVLLDRHGELAIHGVAMRPSSPAGMGVLDGRLVFLLPGNPVSCLCAYDFFAGRAVRSLGGRSADWPYRRITAPLRQKIVSMIGRLDYARVAISGGEVEPLAIGGASMLSSTTRADGFVIVPADSEGFPPGTKVEFFLYGGL